ncbi:MAG: DUF192 domain-containing protein [Rhodoferax sp.]
MQGQGPYTVLLHTRTGQHPLHVRLADTFVQRLRGLMFSASLASRQALLLTKCASVHTAFMRYPIDVVYLDRHGQVTGCEPGLRPWRTSTANTGLGKLLPREMRAAHTLELAVGTIARLHIAPGDRLAHPAFTPPDRRPTPTVVSASTPAPGRRSKATRQQGATMVEFTVVGPVIILLGLSILQYGLMFFAKNQVNHAAFMAARAGSTGNASIFSVENAYVKALIPLYGGGTSSAELAQSYARANADVGAYAKIELLNPTKESYDDWNDPGLQNTLGGGKRVIPNSSLSAKDPTRIGSTSGQSIHDANLIKLKIVHGFEPKVPLLGLVYKKYLQWMDPGTDAEHTRLVGAGRIPMVTHVTLQMQSDAIEGPTVSSPGMGNDGNPVDPGDPPTVSTAPPRCASIGCTTTPLDPGDGECDGPDCPVSHCPQSISTTISADALFPFDKWHVDDMLPAGKAKLDQLIASAQNQQVESASVTGHSDQIGDDAYNMQLSQKRAQSVKDYLLAHGVPAVPISVEGKGETEPKVALSACQGKSGAALKACLAPNRRVVIEIKPKKR